MTNCSVSFEVQEVKTYRSHFLEILHMSASLLFYRDAQITGLQVSWFVRNASAKLGTFFSGHPVDFYYWC